MGRKRRKRDLEGQMTFGFGDCLSAEGGEVKGRDRRGQGSQKPVKRKHEPVCREDLMEKVADIGNLVRAWKRVKANKGAGGTDGMTVKAFDERAWPLLREMRSELLDGRYKPVEVRGVQIPKPDGSKRQLGIPTVKDRTCNRRWRKCSRRCTKGCSRNQATGSGRTGAHTTPSEEEARMWREATARWLTSTWRSSSTR